MKKNLLSLFLFIIIILFSCEQPQSVKGIASHCENGRHQMQTIDKSDNGNILVFVIDTKTGEVTMRDGYSTSWIKLGSQKN